MGISLDIQIGKIPPTTVGSEEFGIGLGKHIGVGYFEANPNACREPEYGGISLHLGIGIGSPIYLSYTDPSRKYLGIDIPADKDIYWAQGK